MSKFKLNPSVIDNLSLGGKVDLNLTDNDILALINVLDFTYSTTKYMLSLEEVKGSKAGADDIRKKMENTDMLLMKIYAAVASIGRPDEELLN